jgi:hypothetical protein
MPGEPTGANVLALAAFVFLEVRLQVAAYFC